MLDITEPSSAARALASYAAQLHTIGAPALTERFVLKHGCSMVAHSAAELDLEWPRWQDWIGEPKQCFRNATLAAHERIGNYVEGFGLRSGIDFPFHHAWIEIDGKVFDPTWRDAELCSYVGVPFDVDVVTKEVLRTGYYGVLAGCDALTFMQKLDRNFDPSRL
jgi:hypothetical protein